MRILKTALPLSLICLAASACAPAIETRISSGGQVPVSAQEKYIFIVPPDNIGQVHTMARNLVADSLHFKDWKEAADGDYAVSVALSALPASLEVHENNAGQGGRLIIEKLPKKMGPFGRCVSMQHRLEVKIFRIADGQEIFSGIASEYHCKADVSETLPYLTNAAMSNFGKSPENRVETRSGRN